MISETLIHINETLNPEQSAELLKYLGNQKGGIEARHHAENPHLLFVAYDPDESCPSDLIAFVSDRGYHAHVVDL